MYVNNIILTGDDNERKVELKEGLTKEFQIGMEFARSKQGIVVNQRSM